MSKVSVTPVQPPNQVSTPNSSAWSRGPPPAASNTSSTVTSTVSTPPPQLNGGTVNDSVSSSAPVSISGHSRKGSMMVGGAVDMKPRGNLAFGTVDSPDPLLSSSPAAPSTTGGHLADAVKSFGSIDAETNMAIGASMIRPPRRTSAGASSATAPQKKLDVHSLFAGKPQPMGAGALPLASSTQAPQGQPAHDRRQSITQVPFPGVNGLPNSGPQPYQQMPGMPGQSHLRPMQGMPGQQRSPVMNIPQPQFANQVPGQQGFRMPQPQLQANQTSTRPAGANGPMMPRPMMGQQGMAYSMHPQAPGYPMMGYPSQGAYYGYNLYEQQYGVPPQWAPQHGSNMPLSPRSAQAQLGHSSPAPPSAALPGSSGASPMPTPPSRPQSLVSGHQPTASTASAVPIPTTPSRPMQPPQQFAGQMLGLSAGAATFTPRAKSSAIKISRPDGTSVNLAEAAAAAKGPTSSVPTSGVVTPETPGDEPPKKKLTLPVIVRLESEEQKKSRLADEEKRRRMKEQEEKEDAERKERRAKEEERKAREKEREVLDKAEQDEAEVKAKSQAEVIITAEQASPDTNVIEQASDEVGDKIEATSEALIPNVVSEEIQNDEPTKSDELGRALATPTTQSAVASPLASPALVAAGLPAKPVGAINGSRRPTPSALDIKTSTQVSLVSTAALSALGSAKPIADLTSIQYPDTIKPPSPDLNVNAAPGKFRYSRDFLMQFMGHCKDKPESLPPLEEIGLEADPSSGFGQNRRGGGRASTSGPSGGRTGLSGLGISSMGGNRSFPGQSMGSFNFGSGSSIRGTTSEDRYNRSLAQGSSGRIGGNMMRTPSQGGSLPPLHGLPPMGQSTSRGGSSRSQRGAKRMPQEPRGSVSIDADVAPLAVSANAWVNARSAGNDEKSPVYIERKVKALLNKLTEEKFESISTQILEWANKSRFETDGMTLKLVIKQVFEKSTDEAHWSAMYAKLCHVLLHGLDPEVTEVIDGKSVSGGSLFRKYLLGRCQADFESGWKAREEAAILATAKIEEDKERLAKIEESKENGGEAPMMSDEYYAAQKAKRRGLGLVQLIGELYKLGMLSKGVIRECLIRLLGNVDTPDEEDLESTCKLLTTVGKQFETTSSTLDVVFERLSATTKNETLSSRIKFMIMDVIDLRRNKWQSRKEVVPTTIAQIHQQAARENAEKAQAAQHARESISRGGSRAGHSRRDGPQPGEWQSVAAGPRPPQRPADFSNIGRGVSSAGLPSAPTFGPSGVFARGKKGGVTGTTPPLSRHSSTSNMFGILNEAAEGSSAPEPRSSSDAAVDTQPQRKRLQLAPRTKPLPGQDEEGDQPTSGEEDAASDDELEVNETPAQSGMSVQAAMAKIEIDVKELWGEKDTGGSRNPEDIVEYYRALPDEHRHLLSGKLIADVFRLSKLDDAKIVAKGWEMALTNGIASTDDLKKGLELRMPGLDDDAIDFPNAYKAVATLIRSLQLNAEDVSDLGDKIVIEGEPRITPKMKLEKALVQVDEAVAAKSSA